MLEKREKIEHEKVAKQSHHKIVRNECKHKKSETHFKKNYGSASNLGHLNDKIYPYTSTKKLIPDVFQTKSAKNNQKLIN